MSEYAGIRIPERETECLRYLLQQGIQLEHQDGAHPHIPDCTGHSPLVEAILKGYTECADILIGAKPGKKERERYFADALEAARQQGNTRLIEKLQNHLP